MASNGRRPAGLQPGKPCRMAGRCLFRLMMEPRDLRMRTAILKAIVLAALLSALAVSPARAEVRILASPGGQVGPFLDLFERVRASGERVVIDGPCLSACTLVLSVVPDDRICVTRRAILGFHAARSIDQRGR